MNGFWLCCRPILFGRKGVWFSTSRGEMICRDCILAASLFIAFKCNLRKAGGRWGRWTAKLGWDPSCPIKTAVSLWWSCLIKRECPCPYQYHPSFTNQSASLHSVWILVSFSNHHRHRHWHDERLGHDQTWTWLYIRSTAYNSCR